MTETTIAPRTKRAYNRKSPRTEAAREPTHTPARSGTEILGRDGEVLSRNSTPLSGDQFEFSDGLKEANWDYQWLSVKVYNNTDIVRNTNVNMQRQGWRPCKSARIAEHFGIKSGKTITVDDLMLYERPEVLSQQARAEDVLTAKRLISDRNESLKLSGVKKGLPDGFEMGKQYRNTGGDIRMSIDQALDVERPSHKLAEPGE